jgi:hypothetical protein
LTWQAATDRFFKASAVSIRDAVRRERIARKQGDERFVQIHEDICKGTSGAVLRTILHGDDPLKKEAEYGHSSSTTTAITTTGGARPSWLYLKNPLQQQQQQQQQKDESFSSTSSESSGETPSPAKPSSSFALFSFAN